MQKYCRLNKRSSLATPSPTGRKLSNPNLAGVASYLGVGGAFMSKIMFSNIEFPNKINSTSLDELQAYAQNLSDDLYKELKHLATKIGKNIEECGADFVKEYMQKSAELDIPLTPSAILGSAFLSCSAADHAIQEMHFDLLMDIFNSISYSHGVVGTLINQKSAQSELMRRYANIRLENDPKQLAKKQIENDFLIVQKQFKRRGYTAQFVKEMGAKYLIFESYKTIENLVAKLKKKYPAS